jgi:NAD(P)-dependent dehydrogenase (short-subunit alcohol dehydrogenase family)
MIRSVYEKYGKLDILVNNVGVQIRDWATELKEEDWDKLMDIDLKSYYFASRAAAHIMQKNGRGAIVCISSANSERFTSKRTPYCIAKTAVNGLVAALGNELGRFGIRVNGVAPGYVMTDMALSAIKEGVLSEEIVISVTPLKRFILQEEIASAVCFLASDEASGITGQTLFVDGGWNKNGLPEPKDME